MAVLATQLWVGSLWAAEKEASYTTADIPYLQVYEFFKTEQMLDDAKTNYNRRLIRMFGKKPFYSRAEITAVRSPGITSLETRHPEEREQKGKAPRDTFTSSVLENRDLTLQQLDPAVGEIGKIREKRFGQQDYYDAAQVRDVENRADGPPPTPEELAREAEINAARIDGQKRLDQAAEGFQGFHIRKDWRDVLYDEDPSVRPEEAKAIGDLTGGQFSYVRDRKASTDTWAAHAALILPFAWRTDPGPGFSLRSFAFAPSVTFDRVTTNGEPSGEQNTVLYRLGVYANFFGLLGARTPLSNPTSKDDVDTRLNAVGLPVGFQVRAAGIYITDFDHKAELPAYEVDFEPRWLAGPFSLGYRHVWLHKSPLLSDGSDNSLLESQLRAWFHLEGGDVQNAAGVWATAAERFLRMGPTVQFTLNAPELIAGKPLSLTLLYRRLYAQEGPTEHDEYFNGTLTWTVYQDPELNRKVTINADYRKGGLNFTDEEVDQFTISLGVLF